jgi:hypothetical protein
MDFLTAILETLSNFEITVGLNNILPLKLESVERITSQSKDFDMSEESEELITHTVKNFMETLIERYSELKGEIIQAVITSENYLVLFCTEIGARYAEQRSVKILETSRMCLGVTEVYVVEMDSRELLSEKQVENILSRIDKNDINPLIPLPTTTSNVEYNEDKLAYSVEELLDIVLARGLDKMPLPKHLCQDVLDYLWDQEKKNLLNL